MNKKIIVGIICGLCATSVFAKSATPLIFSNNDQLSVYLSNTNPNKIVIPGDVISNDSGINGEYSIDKTPDGGVVILPFERKEAITIFLNTRYGRSVSLSVHSHKGEGKTYSLEPESKPVFIENEDAKTWEESQPYVQTIKEILKAVTHNEVPTDYFEYSIDKKHKYPAYQPYSPIKIMRERLWVGNNLSVTQYQMTNTSNQSLNLQERYFFTPGVRAVSLSKKRLFGQEVGIVWIVTETAKVFGEAE